MLRIDGATADSGFEGSDADFYAPLKPMMLGETVITTPLKV